MASYELSKLADKDYQNIFEFGIDNFGLNQAIDYQQGMTKRFEDLAEHPENYVAVNHIRHGYRRSVYRSHSIYYQKKLSGVFIIRILGAQDIEKSLPNSK